MQLEFFGETFDRSKCRKTCDNCQAGRDINKRDLTEVAKSMLSLLSSVQAQSRNGQSVTLLRLTELFRGSKAKGTTKFLNVSNLRGYGDAAKYKLKKKQDIDRVAHAMILEKILMETSELNKQGFSNDYVQPGEKAQAILAGRFRFFVDFPKETSKDKENSTNAEASKKKKKAPTNSKKATGGNRKKRSLNNDDENASIAGDDGGLKFHQVLEAYEEDDDDDESLSSKNRNRAASAVLSPVKAKELQKVVKDLATCWAKEEECFGNNVYCK